MEQVSEPVHGATSASTILKAIPSFRKEFEAAKAAQSGIDFEWYSHDSLGSLALSLELLSKADGDIFSGVRNRRMLDIGCADGANAFLFNSLGFDVLAVDFESFNHNQMRGVRCLRNYFSPAIGVRSMNLDSHSIGEDEDFGIVLALGLLYHLKNPIKVLESLAMCSEYCVLSTRVIEDSSWRLGGRFRPHAYLVEPTELNADETNYWLFTPVGLERLLRRTGWRMTASHVVDGLDGAADRRMFCIAQSTKKRLWKAIHGLYASEEHGWRWTRGSFAVKVSCTAGARGIVELHLALPDVIFIHLGPITIQLRIEGSDEVTEQTLTAAGSHIVSIDSGRCSSQDVTIAATLSQHLPPSEHDSRELGLILTDVKWTQEA